MQKEYISSNFHGAGKFPTTKMKSFMVTICVGSFKQIVDRDTPTF